MAFIVIQPCNKVLHHLLPLIGLENRNDMLLIYGVGGQILGGRGEEQLVSLKYACNRMTRPIFQIQNCLVIEVILDTLFKQ